MKIRYFFQIIIMLTDVVIIGASAIALYQAPLNPLVWFVVIMSYKTWEEQGGFIGWEIKNIKSFLSEAKKIGL